MAEEAFALSPISARAALPSEEDYVAINEAFMETSRGRWFLGEYAKRNRNSDTRMVLDAVTRIEETIASQKQAAADTRLNEAVAALRQAVDATQAATSAALEATDMEPHLAPIRKGVRIIREISWGLREIGADGRICDILDSQVAAIETSSEAIAAVQVRPAVDAAFAELLGEFEKFEARGEAPAPVPPEARARVVPFPTPAEPEPVAEVKVEAVAPEPEPPAVEAPVEAEIAFEVPPEAIAFLAPPEPETPAPAVEQTVGTNEATEDDALDDALDLIAAEMSASDPIGMDELFEIPAEPLPVVASAPVAPAPEIIAAPVVAEPRVQPAATVAPHVSTAPQPVMQVATAPAAPPPTEEISLGSSILASGILKKPAPVNDPLAPLRRMSQAERIAFFS